MDKQQITRQLHRLAQEEIPDSMNLWPSIQGKLKRKAKPRSLSLAPALSAFVMLILVSIGGYAAYQSRMNTTAPTAPHEMTQYNLVQTVGGATAILDWAYADAHIINVQYTLIYNAQEMTPPDSVNTELFTADGLQIPQTFGGGSGSHGENDTYIHIVNELSFDASVIEGNPENLNLLLKIDYGSAYVAPYLAGTATPFMGDFPTVTPLPMGDFQATVPPPDTFNPTATAYGDIQPTVMLPVDGSMTATPIPGGEFQPTVPPPDSMTIEPSLIPPMQFTPTPVPANSGPNFYFNFTVPFHPAKTGTAEQAAVEANGLTMEIQNLSITPMITNFDLCFNLPDMLGEWYAKTSIATGYLPAPDMPSVMPAMSLDGQIRYAVPDYYFSSSPMMDNPNRSANCMPLSAMAPFSSEGGKMEIVVDYLYRVSTAPTERSLIEADEAFFRERGFDLSYAFVPFTTEEEATAFYSQSFPENVMVYPLPEQGAMVVTVRDYPNNLQMAEAQQYIYDNMLRERYLGPWIFRVNVEP